MSSNLRFTLAILLLAVPMFTCAQEARPTLQEFRDTTRTDSSMLVSKQFYVFDKNNKPQECVTFFTRFNTRTGKITEEYQLDIRGNIEGTRKVYYPNGNPKELIEYYNSVKGGKYCSFYQNEGLHEVGSYRRLDTLPEVKCDTVYVQEYGHVRIDLTCPDASIKAGTWFRFSESGDLLRSEAYDKNGSLIK